MDRAFSSVSGLRRRSSRVPLPMAAVLVTITVFGPKLRSRPVMAPSRPAMIEPTPITAPVPMITPSTVRNDLILCARIVSNARRTPETTDPRVISPPSRPRWDLTPPHDAPGRCRRTGPPPPTTLRPPQPRSPAPKVPRLFEVEKYPTLWQMPSTIEARTSATLSNVFRALFPPASITGAPKVRTMQIIAQIETSPRRVYTGTIGFIAPGRRAQFNVAIRTLLWNRQIRQAEYGVGSGITWGSQPEAEWQECRIKTRILDARVPAFSLLETMLWTPEDGYTLLDRHLQRLAQSAVYFGFAVDLAAVGLELERVAAQLARTRNRPRTAPVF